MKILFMGTPDFARICMQALVEEGMNVIAAVTQPDKPKGRGYELMPSAVKVYAEGQGIPVYQPETLRNGAFEETLQELAPDLIAVAAYGKILPPYILDYPRLGCINVHGSLLPKYRGAAPINRAIMDGEAETGITIMYMNEGLDTGDMLHAEKTPITVEDNFETIHDRLAVLGGSSLIKVIRQLEDGKATPQKQDDTMATYAAKITKEDCILDFKMPAGQLVNIIKGLSPFPLAMTRQPDGRLLKVISAVKAGGSSEAKPGTVVSMEGDGFEVACGGGTKLLVTGVLPEGKGRMSAVDFLRGRRLEIGNRLEWR